MKKTPISTHVSHTIVEGGFAWFYFWYIYLPLAKGIYQLRRANEWVLRKVIELTEKGKN